MIKRIIAPQGGVTRAVLAIALAANYAFAQAPTPAPAADTALAVSGEEETELAPITVSANAGIEAPLESSGVSVTVLNSKELREEGVLTLTEALTRVPGAYVQAGGGLEGRGNTSKMAIRGMGSSQATLPVLDGMRLFNASDIGNISPNLIGSMNTFDIGALELLRGSQAAVYGVGNMGGVLYMTTPKGMDAPSYSVFTEMGSFDSVTSNATAQGQVGKLSYFVSATYERTDNDIRYSNGSRPAGDIGSYEAWQEALRLDYQVNDANSVTLTYRRSDTDYESTYGHNAIQSNLITAAWSSQISENYISKLMLGYNGADLDLGDYYSHYDNIQLDWSNEYKWDLKHATTFGISWNRNDGEVPSNARQDGLESVIGLHVGHTYTPAENWENSVSLRLDNSSIFDNHFSFRAASSYKFNAERTRVYGSVSSGYMSPTSFERSRGFYSTTAWGYTSNYYGNPDLDVSTSMSVDFGLEQSIKDKHKISATLFWSQIYDGINTDDSYNPATGATEYRFSNSDQVWTMQGIEIALRGEIAEKWNTGYSLSWTLTQPKTADDKQVADTARQVWSADIHTSPMEKLTVGFGLSGVVGRTDWSGTKLDNYAVLRAYAKYQATENIQLHLRVENLTDQDYVTSPGYYSPDTLGSGIGIYGGISIKF